MGTLTQRIEQAEKDSAYELEGLGNIADEREKAIVDRHKSELPGGGLMQKIATGLGEMEIEQRRQQRAYAEKPPTTMAKITAPLTKDMLSNLGDRARVLAIYRNMSPDQRAEAVKLAPGIAQIGGDDRGGFLGRVGSAAARGVAAVSQPIMELGGQLTGTDWGGSTEEIEFIRKLEGAAAQEFNPARPGDPWYERGPVQALEMLPWMATTVGGAGLGRTAATGIASRVATSAAAGSKVAGMAQKAGQVAGNLPTKIPGVGKYIPALTAGKAGELAGITAAAFPSQYAQEVDQLKAIGMVDDTRLRLLAGGTAAVTGLVEGLVPNPFGGKVSLTEGAAKAARQYLWEAAKKAPGELTEEYLQGVVSGLGEHVAQHIGSETETKDAEGNVVKTNPAQKKTIADAFSKGWKQAQEAALPMAFLLGGSAIGGTAMSAARATNAPPVGEIGDTMSPPVPPVQPLPDRVAKLEEVTSKGFVSEEDAASVGIAGANRKERLANAKSEIEQLKALAVSPPSPVPPEPVEPVVEQPTDATTDEERMRQEEAVKAQYSQEIARRRAAKAQPQPTGDIVSPPPLPDQPASQSAVVSTAEKVPPLEPVKTEANPSWVKYDESSYGVKIDDPNTGNAEATLSYRGNESSIYVDMFAAKKDAPKGSGKKILRSIVETAKEYNPRFISGNFTNSAALGAFGSEFGKENVTFQDKRRAQEISISFEEAMKNPASYIARVDLTKAATSKRTGRKDESASQSTGDTMSPIPASEIATPKSPDKKWKSEDRVFVQGHTTGSGVKIPNSVGKVRKVNADNVVVQIDGETNLRAVSKDKLQLPDATFEKGEKVGLPWAAEKEAKVTDVLPDGRYELSVAGRRVVEPADRMVKLPATEVKAKPTGDTRSPIEESSIPMPATFEELEALPKYSIYGRKSSDGSKVRYQVRGDGKRGGGDSIHDTIEQAQEEAALVKRRDEDRKASEEKQKADEEADKKKQADYEASFGGFLSDNAMNKGRQLKVLGASRSYQGKVVTVKDIVEQNVANGAVVDDKGRLMSPDGSWLGSDKLTKIGIDYARHLIEAKAGDIVSLESKRDQEKQDAPKTKGGGDPNEVQTETKAEAQGQVGDVGGQAAVGEAPSPASSIRKAIEDNGGYDKNSADDVEAIRRKLYDGEKTPSHADIRAVMQEMKNEAGQKPVKDDGKPKPPKGYKPLKEFTPVVTQTLSPDLELQENRDGIKELGLKKGEAVGYRVYPKRGSSKGGYWKYGIVRYEPTGSHASIELEDGTIESVGGSRLIRLEQESLENSENVPARSDKSSELDSKPVKQPEGVGSVAPESGGAALPASEQSQDDAALEAMIRAEFEKQMGTAKPNAKPKPAKRTGKKDQSVASKPKAEKKTNIEQAADKARSEVDDLWKELNDLGRTELSTGLNPKLAALAVKIAIAEIKADTLTFAAFVERSVAKISPDMLDKLKPYMEKAWEVAYSMGMTKDRGGKFDNYLKEGDYGNQRKSGADTNAAMEDGVGQPDGNGATVSDAANEGRSSQGDAGQEGDTVLRNDDQTTEVDGSEGSGRVGTDGNTNANQSEQGQPDATDAGRGSDAESMADQRSVNHVIGPDDDIAVASLTKSLSRNIDALRLLKTLETEGKFPDEAERKALAQYTGWGGLSQALDSIKGERMLNEQAWGRDENWESKWGSAYRKLKDLLSKEEFQAAQNSTENAHYTSKPIIQALWKITERLGFDGGRVLELGAGIGHFAGLVPSRVRGQTQFVMVERDSVSSRIAKMLYPRHEVVAGDMEEFKAVPGSVTIGIGNVPFAGGTVGDSVTRYKEDLNLHNYSIARHLDAVAPGGVVVVISTHNTLDSNIKQRKFLASKGELIGAIRLPNDAFAENAKTEVVTDVLIFRRPRQGDGAVGVRFDQNAEITVKNKDGKDVVKSVNKYFIDNPEMVLGEHSAKGSLYGADEYTVNSTAGSLQSKLDAAIEKLPRNLLGRVDIAERVVESDKTVPFGRLEVRNGKVVMGFGDKFVPIEGKKFEEFPVHLTGKTGVSRAKDYIELRDLLANVRNVMLSETASDEAVNRSQMQLSKSYDRYVEKHGPLNSGKTGIFVRDPDYYRVLALENERSQYNAETKKIDVTYEKASIFTERVLGPQKEPESASSSADAMSMSMAWRGAIDSMFVGKLLGITAKEAEAKLIEDGLAFRNPSTTELELADLYLSGNVRSKLEQAKIVAAEDPQYERNVEALTKVMPPDVTIKKDTVRLGATWIPEHVINAFATQAFGTEVNVSYNANTDAWTVPRLYSISETAKAKYKTDRIEPAEVLAETLNLRSIKVYDRKETGEVDSKGYPKTTQVLNEKETQAAKHRASVLRADFEKWVMENAEVSDALGKIYNDKYNNFVRTKYNGDFLVLPGANPEIELRPYQKDAIWRIINRGTSLLAHAVGSGKTYTMIGAAMEMRRLGLARRPLLVVQNATLGQFATSFQKMYPNANVLVANKEDLGKGKRQLFLNKVSTGNWDAVVMAQSTFDNMASDPDVERAFIQDQLDLLEEAIREEGGESSKTPTVKQLVRTKKALKNRFDSLMGSRAKKEDNVTFEEMGADALFLDEAHAYKKPTFTTKLSQLVGLNVEASARSLATTIKVRSVQSSHNGRNVVLATGTPVTNTLGEAWHMVNYVSPATNAAFSSRTFDQFIGNFAQVEPTLTMNAGGQYVYKDAIVKFRNGHQLVEYINDSWDIVTPDNLRAYMEKNSKGFPTLRDGQTTAITVNRTPGVAAFMDYIARVYERFKNLPAKERREMSYIPAIAYGASKAATLDIRLVVPGATEEKNSKLQKAADEIKRIYDESSDVKGTQLFFSDMKNPFSMSRLRQFMGGESIDAFAEDDADPDSDEAVVSEDNESGSFLYQELKRKLLAKGIPNEQIAFIADAKTDKQRQALFERVNNGDIRVLIGSTAKMGVGVNVQKKLVGLHHFDTPWLPADLEQREGRILRFGNENQTVEIIRYAMKKTLDGAIYMSTARKQKFIWQVLNGNIDGDSFEDPSSASMLSIEEQLAAIQDDPVFFEKIDIQNRLRELELERQSFFDAQRRVTSSLAGAKSNLDYAEKTTIPLQEDRVKRIEKFKADGALDTFSMDYEGKKFTDEKKAAELVKDKVEEIRKYVMKNFDGLQTIARAGGVLSLKDKQKFGFKLGPANVVIGAGPAFITEDVDGKSVTRSTARIESVVYLNEPLGRIYEIYNGAATVPSTLIKRLETLLEDAQGELSRSISTANSNREKIKELEGLTGKTWEDQAEYDAKKNRLSEIETQMLASGGSLRSDTPTEKTPEEEKLDNDLNDLPGDLYQTEDVDPSIRTQALDIALTAEAAGIRTFDKLVAYSVKTVGESRTREIGTYLRLAAEAAGFAGVRQTNDVLGSPNVTREQAVTLAKAAFPMLSDEQIEAGVTIIERIGLLDKVGFAPAGTPIPSLPRSGDAIVRDGEEIKSDRVKGWTQFISATRAVIGATNKADVSTFIHEFFHPTRKFLLDRNIPQEQRFGISDEDIKALEDYSGVKDGNWDRAAEEKAAKAWEQYWFEGRLPSESLGGLFKKMARWMRSVYNGIYQITGGQLPSEVRSLFDKLVQRSGDQEIGDTMSPIEDSDVTSIKNALVNEGRINRGVPALGDVASQTQQEWLDAADAILQDDPMVGDRLVKELNEKPRNLSNIEVAVMQIHYRQMNNRLEKVSDRLFEAKEGKDAAESAKALIDVDIVMNALIEIEEATKKAGREWGRAGVARQIELEKDFSLAAIMRKARIANGGNALNEKQLEEMRELARRVAELEGDLAKANQVKLDFERKKNVEAQIEDSKTKVEPIPKAIRKKAVDKLNAFKNKFAAIFASSSKTDSLYATEDEQMADEAESVIQAYVDMGIFSLGEFLANIRKDLGADLPVSVQAAFATAWKDMHDNGDIPSPMIDKSDVRGLSRLAKQIERSLVEAGITERDKVVQGVHESLQEIVPDITVRETMDAMSGYGQYSYLSDGEADKIIRDINGQLQQLAKLDDMRAGVAPAKTGVERRTMSDEERRLVAQVNEAKRRGGFVVSDPEGQLKSAIAATKTALRNRIKDLQFEIDRKEKIVRTRTDTKADPEVIELRKQRDELMKQHKELFPKPEATMEQRISATSRVLDRVIADLEEQLRTGEFNAKKQSEPISTPELDAKRARIEALREQRDSLRGVQKRTPEQIEKAYKANLLKQLADYKDRMAKSEFDPKPRKEVRVLSQSEFDLKKELQDVKDQFFRMAADYRLANMSPRERVWDYVKETAHLSRALMTSLDFSAVFRQGGTVAFAHPKIAVETSKEMYKAMWDASSEFATAEKIRNDALYQFAITAGLQITEEEGKITKQEEAYMGRWARQGIGSQGTKLNAFSQKLLSPVAASARGYMTFLNGIRFKLFKHMIANLGKGGQVTADEAKVIAMYINAATGRSDLGPMMRWAEQMNMLFFAPRFVASRFQYLGMPLWLLGSRKVSGRVKKAIAMEYIRHATGIGAFLATTVALGALLGGDDEEEKPTVSLDPRSSDFLKIKFGETRIDPMSGLSQVIVLMGRIASGQRVGADGEVVNLRGEDVPYGGLGVAGTAGNFVRTKFAPIPGAAFDIATGENVVGQPVTPFSSLVNLFIPLSLREIKDTAESRGIPQGAVLTILSLHGMGASTYGPESNYRKGTAEQREKQFDKDLKKMTFDSKEPAYKGMLTKEQMSQMNERREGRKQGLVYAASSNPIRKVFKNDDSYSQAVKERDVALENLKKSGLSLDESRGLLIKHWESNYGSAKEVRGGVRVYKEALSDRLKQLRKVYAE